ncbi:glycosyltransferase [Candidatus Pacearchaeota archaeon]|nr:glycosyltransferase [Candidatus Pacearchaeota archaeon]
MKLSIIIPAYNEEKRILSPLNSFYNFFNKKLGKEFEVIVVPNNCKDNTLNVVKDFAKDKKNIVIFNINKYSGKGGAVIQGFKLAKGDLIGFVDADESTSVIEFNKLYENINSFDGIIASRQMKGAKIHPKRTFKQEFGSFLFNRFTNLLFNLKFKDTQCGAKLFKKNVVSFLIKHSTQKDWMFDVDLLYLCKKKKFRIREYPIFWSDSDGSKLILKEQLIAILNLIKYRFKP